MDIEAVAGHLANFQNYAIRGTSAPEIGRASRDSISSADSERSDRRHASGSSESGAGGVSVLLSDRAQALSGVASRETSEESESEANEPEVTGSEASGDHAAASAETTLPGGGPPGELSDEDQDEVRRLRARDTEVRAHENAHKAAAGRHSRGGPSFEFEQGPDGRRYAVGGEVSIDTSSVSGDPDATIQKMRQVRRAALAPANPSSQDRKVAAQASQAERAAQSEKLAERAEKQEPAAPNAIPRAYAAANAHSTRAEPGQLLDLSA